MYRASGALLCLAACSDYQYAVPEQVMDDREIGDFVLRDYVARRAR